MESVRSTRGGRVTAWSALAVAGLVFLAIQAAPACRDAFNDARQHAKDEFEDYSAHLEKTIAEFRQDVQPGTPANASLAKAYQSYRLAQNDRGRNLEAATRQLDQANEYICEVQKALWEIPCSPREPDTRWVNDELVVASFAGLQALVGGGAAIVGGVKATRSWMKGAPPQ